MTDDDIIALCRKHGAKVASDAAYAAMGGRKAAATALGIGALPLPELYRVTVLAYGLMSDEDQAADLGRAVVDAAKSAAPPKAPPRDGDLPDNDWPEL